MLTLIVICLFAGVVLFDWLPSKKRPKKHSVIYFALLSVSFGVLILFSLGVDIPGPSEPIGALVETVFPQK